MGISGAATFHSDTVFINDTRTDGVSNFNGSVHVSGDFTITSASVDVDDENINSYKFLCIDENNIIKMIDINGLISLINANNV